MNVPLQMSSSYSSITTSLISSIAFINPLLSHDIFGSDISSFLKSLLTTELLLSSFPWSPKLSKWV